MSCSKPLSSILKQDYEKLKRESLQRKRPFIDEEFEADDASIGNAEGTPKGMVWMRPKEICTDHRLYFIKNGMTLPDVLQRGLGDCWFVAAAASLTLHPKLLERVVPQDQTFDDDAGIFRFRFWHFGQWVEVVVDDRLPTNGKDLVYARSTDHNEFWMPLLEKAYAKKHGSYEAIVGGFMGSALVDLTGGIGETVWLRRCDAYFNLCKMIKKALHRNSLMGASIKGASGKDSNRLKGLRSRHAYSIIGYKKITVEEKKVKLLKLRNPWGRNGEWTGDWSDKDEQNWKKLDTLKRKELRVIKNDGEFWMDEHDFREIFHRVHICHLSADAPKEGRKSFRWESSSFQGHLLKHHSFDNFWMNPQFHVKLLEPDEGHPTCTLLVSLMQKDQCRKRKGLLNIGYAVYQVTEEYVKLKDPARRKELLSNLSPRQKSSPKQYEAIEDTEELTGHFELPRGDYLIIPMNMSSEAEAEFLLRIFTEKKHHSSDITLEKPQAVLTYIWTESGPAESEEYCYGEQF